MSILSFREVLPRTFNHKFGEAPTAERKFVVSLSEPAATQAILNHIGILFGSPHPEYTYLYCTEGTVTETDRHYAEAAYRYEVPATPESELNVNPMARADVWTFSVGGAQVPALTYYHGSNNGDVRPLVNATGDFFEGLTATEAEVRATINSNRLTFDLALAANVTNSINANAYLGGAPYTWLCAGINANRTVEAVGQVMVRYWQISVELIYRRSGYVMKLPHVGWHYNDPGSGNQKLKAWVYEEQDDATVQVSASSPQPLTPTGELKYPGSTGVPDILERRVHPAIDFSSFFGTPPF